MRTKRRKAIAPYLREEKRTQQLTLEEVVKAAGDLTRFSSAKDLYEHLAETQGKLLGLLIKKGERGQGLPFGELKKWATTYFQGETSMPKAATSRRLLRRALLERKTRLAPPSRGLPGRRFKTMEEPVDLYETEVPEEVEEEEAIPSRPLIPRLPSRRLKLRKLSRTARARRRHALHEPTPLTRFAKDVLVYLRHNNIDPSDERLPVLEAITDHLPNQSEWLRILSKMNVTLKDLDDIGLHPTDKVDYAVEMYLVNKIEDEVLNILSQED